ncbi:hypothetical protein HDV05_001482, partial [Chytridiales sp. JEL 0842]
MGDAVAQGKELGLPDNAVTLCKEGTQICLADSDNYRLVNVESGISITLFPYDRSVAKPAITPVGNGEFLLTMGTPQQIGLGMFVNAKGDAVKGTIEWPAVPKSIAYHFPYIIALLRNGTIEIHNMPTQELVQTIPLPVSREPRYLSSAYFSMDLFNTENKEHRSIKVVVGCKDAVLGLSMLSLEEQIDLLFNGKKIQEAVKLGEQIISGAEGETTQSKNQKLLALYQKTGLHYLKETLFDDALSFFQKGLIDPCGLLILFPEFHRHECSFTFSGTLAFAGQWGTMENIISRYLVENYPDLEADTHTSFQSALDANGK